MGGGLVLHLLKVYNLTNLTKKKGEQEWTSYGKQFYTSL